MTDDAEAQARLAERATDRALREAEERGRLAAIVDSRLAEHDRHLSAINGSIGELAVSVKAIERRLDANATAQETRDMDAHRAQENQVSTRTFVLGLIAMTIALAGVVLGALGAVGTL